MPNKERPLSKLISTDGTRVKVKTSDSTIDVCPNLNITSLIDETKASAANKQTSRCLLPVKYITMSDDGKGVTSQTRTP